MFRVGRIYKLVLTDRHDLSCADFSPVNRRPPLTRWLLATTALIAIATLSPAQTAYAGQLSLSAFTAYSSANYSAITAGPGALYSVNVDSIAPTQLNEGFTEVDKKAAGFDLITTQAALTANLLTSIEPVVIGPGGKLYLTDGHHTFTALIDSTWGAFNPTVYVDVIANYSNLTESQFWTTMQANNYVYPINDGVPQAFNVNTGAPIPSSLTGLTSDPYRGLEYSILKNKSSALFPTASNITGAAGASTPGLDKITGFYSDFIEADAYRGANGGLGLPYLSPGDIALATQWNLNPNSTTTLPNVTGTVTAAQLPGFILSQNIAINGTISNATLANGTLDGNGTFTGITSITDGSVTIGTPQVGLIMQLGSDKGYDVTLSGTNTYTGGTTIIAGDLIVASDASLGAAPATYTYNASTIKTDIQAANGIVFNSLDEGNGTLTLGTAAGGGTSTFTLDRPIAVSGETATINVNGYVVSLTGQIVSLGAGGGLGNATGESDLTIDDLNSGTQGKLILSGNNPYFYGNFIIGNTGSPTVEVMSDAALGNTSGNPSLIGQVDLNGGTFQVGANITAPERNFFLGSGSTFDLNGFTSSWGLLTDVQRTLIFTNSNATTAGSVTFSGLSIGATADLQLNGGAAGESVTFTNGISRTGKDTLIIQPSSATSLGLTDKLFSGTAAASLENGIAPVWIVTNNDAGTNGKGPYDFVTYGVNGYVKAAYTSTAALNNTTGSEVVALSGTSTATAGASVFALNTEGKTLSLSGVLTVGDGSNPAGVILASGSKIQNGTLAFGGSEGVIWMSGAGTISSTITGSNGLTFAGSGSVALSAANVSGALTIDSGTVTLAGTNVFSTDTAGILLDDTKSKPAAATLAITANNTLTALNSVGNNSAVTLSGGAALTLGDITNNLSSTLSSSITETGVATAGALTFQGSGLFDLSGGKISLVTGSTILVENSAQFRVTASELSKSTIGVVLSGTSELQFAQNGGSVLTNAVTVSGTGAVHLIGGTLQITGTSNTYSGGTIVEIGSTLDITTANLPAANPNITNAGGTVVFDQTTNGTYAGVISDGCQMETSCTTKLSGTLIKDDSTGANGGNVILSQAQTFTGMTYIEAGTLTLGATNTLITSQGVDLGRVGGGATAVLALGANQTLAMLTSETSNTTTVTLGGNTLTLGTASGVNPNASFTFGGVIADGSAQGNLVKAGTGNVVLTGANTYTGSTTINGGILEVDGSLASSNVIVNTAATLSGNGTIGDPTINAGGTLAPGTAAAIGTLTINGPLTFLAGSNYNVRVTPTSNDLTNVIGQTTINGGTVNVAAGSGQYSYSNRYTILSSTLGVTGTFSGAASNMVFLTPSLSYDADDVYLTLTRNNVSFASVAGTQNQAAVGHGLDNASVLMPGGNGLTILGGLFSLSAGQAQTVLDSLSGEGITAANTAGLQMSSLFTGAMSDQSTLWLDGGHGGNEMVLTEPAPGSLGSGTLGYAPSAHMKTPIAVHDPILAPIRTWRAWASGFGADETVHGDTSTGSAAQSLSYYGGAMGVDYQINPNLLFGIAGSGSNGDFTVPGRSTYGSVTGGQVGAYGVATFGSYYLASSTSLGFFHNSETRLLSGFGGLAGETDHGSFDSIVVRTRLEAGRRFENVYGATVTPFVSLEIANLHSNGFNEAPATGAGVFALNTQGGDTASVPATLGLRFETLYGLGNGMSLRPVLSLAWGHDFAPQRNVTNALLALPGSSFEISGAQIARDFAQAKAGFELAFAPNAVAFVNFDGNFSSRDQLYGGKGGVKFTW